MAKQPEPWYWEARNAWYVIVGGKRVQLGQHPKDCKPPEKSKKTGRWSPPQPILDAFHNLMTQGTPRPEEAGDGMLVADVFQSFITWCRQNRAQETTDRYFDFLDRFNEAHLGLRLRQMNAAHVTTWLDKQPGWNSTTKRSAITAIMRAFNWGAKNMGLTRNPILGMEKPEAKTRTDALTLEEFEVLLRAAKPRFADLLIVSWDSGARPFEVKRLEARHCQLDKQRAVIPKEEAKGRKRPRVFYFPTQRSLEVMRRLCEEHPEGPLFLNQKRKAWTAMAVKCAFASLDHVLGRRVTHYSLRHSFVTRKLVAGVDSHIVAALAGHRDTSMIDKVYSHVAEDHGYMLEQAKKGS